MHSCGFTCRSISAPIRTVYGFSQVQTVVNSNRRSPLLHDVPHGRGNTIQRHKKGGEQTQTITRNDNRQLDNSSSSNDSACKRHLSWESTVHRGRDPPRLVPMHSHGHVVDVPRERRHGAGADKHCNQRFADAFPLRANGSSVSWREQYTGALGLDCYKRPSFHRTTGSGRRNFSKVNIRQKGRELVQ